MKVFGIFVHGRPRPKGSTKWIAKKLNDGTWKAVPLPNKNLGEWTKILKTDIAVRADIDGFEMWSGDSVSLVLQCVFFFERPANHYKANGDLKPGAPVKPNNKGVGDTDKLVRCAGDCLSGIIYDDDCRLSTVVATREWGSPEGAQIRVFEERG
jgi:hypothetical protein